MKKASVKHMKNIVCWSGGKDSTATIILAHEHGVHLDHIIISLPWFDRKREIYADHPAHVEWVLNYAKPLFESWGYQVDVVSSDKDYIYWFNKVVSQSKYPERNGLIYGFVIAGMCKMNQSKIKPIQNFIRDLKCPVTTYEGIAADETKRLEGMHRRRDHVSLLEKYDVKEWQTYEICAPFNLLSPIYKNRSRQGCWFCPNQSIEEAAEFKKEYPHLWEELKPFAEATAVGKTNARCFKYNLTFEEFENQVDTFIIKPPAKQLSLFDYF